MLSEKRKLIQETKENILDKLGIPIFSLIMFFNPLFLYFALGMPNESLTATILMFVNVFVGLLVSGAVIDLYVLRKKEIKMETEDEKNSFYLKCILVFEGLVLLASEWITYRMPVEGVGNIPLSPILEGQPLLFVSLLMNILIFNVYAFCLMVVIGMFTTKFAWGMIVEDEIQEQEVLSSVFERFSYYVNIKGLNELQENMALLGTMEVSVRELSLINQKQMDVYDVLKATDSIKRADKTEIEAEISVLVEDLNALVLSIITEQDEKQMERIYRKINRMKDNA